MSELDLILREWHVWQRGYRPVRGYHDRAQGCEDHRTSRQYDDVTGALDDDLHERTMRSVDHEIAELPPMPRMCIAEIAMTLARGHSLQRNPRLPTGPERRERSPKSYRFVRKRLRPFGNPVRKRQGAEALSFHDIYRTPRTDCAPHTHPTRVHRPSFHPTTARLFAASQQYSPSKTDVVFRTSQGCDATK